MHAVYSSKVLPRERGAQSLLGGSERIGNPTGETRRTPALVPSHCERRKATSHLLAARDVLSLCSAVATCGTGYVSSSSVGCAIIRDKGVFTSAR
jgi:hypothetical protein